MSKEIYYKLAEELERNPTDDEMADAMADLIDKAHERHMELMSEEIYSARILAKKSSLEKLIRMKAEFEKAGWPWTDTPMYHQMCNEINLRNL